MAAVLDDAALDWGLTNFAVMIDLGKTSPTNAF